MPPLPLSVHDVIDFTPSSLTDLNPAPVIRLGVPDYKTRAKIRREIAAAGARYVGEGPFLTALAEGVEALGPDNAEALLADIDVIRLGAPSIEADEDERAAYAQAAARVDELVEILRPLIPKVASIIADRQYFMEMAPAIALQALFRGITHGDFKLPPRALAPADYEVLIARLGDASVAEAGFKALSLMSLDEATRKNSGSPPESLPSPGPSTLTTHPVTTTETEMTATEAPEPAPELAQPV